MTESLFQPLQVSDITIPNCITMSTLTCNRAEDTYPTDLMKEYYVQRFHGGAGLIVTEGTLITRQGYSHPNCHRTESGLWDDKHVEGWKNITYAVHDAVWHVGRAAHPEAYQQKLAGEPVYALSAISARGGKFRTIPGILGYVTFVAQFKHAAINAKKAGFDGVELHGANGYLIAQFLDTTSNHRTDEWGGSKENRSRLGLEVLKALIEVFGKNVALKVTPAGGYNDVGMPLDETFRYFISEADKLGLAYITLSRYSPSFDAVYNGVPRATKHDVLEGAELVAAGKIDAISIGLKWTTHPDLTKRVEHHKPLDNVPDNSGDWSTGYTDYPVAVY
ncbi:flavoprotein NADH-dependent oxidoreductase [Gymnopilus junonius]|uniref:Flavoprotein NADH-dependent oxidoreductase n=1 Tax=Gymnopilus junonius TaxID=109634 RepID=A0A9P5TRH8_GYMJU|nr:flavoprotein NADH-dependent oxidoreductase [Gymnopilus junonius]